jgi:hypothetical protein
MEKFTTKIHAKVWISIVGFAELLFLKLFSAYMNLDYTINSQVNRGEILPFITLILIHMSY